MVLDSVVTWSSGDQIIFDPDNDINVAFDNFHDFLRGKESSDLSCLVR